MTKEEKKQYNKEYREKNKEKIIEYKKNWYEQNKTEVLNNKKKYKEENKELLKQKNKQYREANKEKIKQYREANKEKIKQQRKQYREANKEKINEYEKNKRKTDLIYWLKSNLRTNIAKMLKRKGYTKNSKTIEILGCTFEEFKLYLESKFESWMTWDNRGLYNGTPNYGWDIDHIIPSSSAITEKDVIKLNHYTNLQPMCSYYNRDVKKDNIN